MSRVENEFRALEKYEEYLKSVKRKLYQEFSEVEHIVKRYKMLKEARADLQQKEEKSAKAKPSVKVTARKAAPEKQSASEKTDADSGTVEVPVEAEAAAVVDEVTEQPAAGAEKDDAASEEVAAAPEKVAAEAETKSAAPKKAAVKKAATKKAPTKSSRKSKKTAS